MGTQTFSVCVLGLFVLLAYTSASSDVFESVLGNTVPCHKSCEMTYTLHTYPRVSRPRDEESGANALLALANVLTEVDEAREGFSLFTLPLC